MAYDARQIANWFIRRAAREGRALSIMSILKLAYIAHGWFLESRGRPLFNNRIEAWQHGPVIPDVYSRFRKQGVIPNEIDPDFDENPAPEDEKFLEEIYTIYGSMPPFTLSELTHVAGGPWHTAREIGGWYAPIPDNIIRTHYEAKRRAANQSHVNNSTN
jgi:uncharacterized phage-associated protein